ncbi:sirohydrochlorin chelatase [Rhizocola hellebori]|uniref:Sirohydrochlorin chelatase n=1 Tax=Rhizocola hellebori TaxID=1392758 RepID=A0A8J3VML0_9ACTN|nr:CbiX/SirB N-terminal domain-containing protein [Rhizocola hellebori]GIH11248.1 sirohydrochlorin chelatase [Rhizocola hellebori]
MPLRESSPRSVLLVAHGSQDPRAAACVRALARTVAAVRPGLDVRVAFLEQSPPSPAEVLRAMPAGTVVVPLLLTNAFHGSIDLPAQVAGFDCVITETLGAPTEPLLTALSKRLPGIDFDGLVLAAAGTRMASARDGIEDVAAALSARFNVPCRVAYAAGVPPTGAAAVTALRAEGCRRIAVASYFLAPGRLYDMVIHSALSAGAAAAAPPLGASWHMAQLILDRANARLLAPAA